MHLIYTGNTLKVQKANSVHDTCIVCLQKRPAYYCSLQASKAIFKKENRSTLIKKTFEFLVIVYLT